MCGCHRIANHWSSRDRQYHNLFCRSTQSETIQTHRVYDLIAETESKIADVQIRLENVRRDTISADHVYQFLLCFDQLYDQFTDAEKKIFMNSFIERIEIYPERQPNGQILKHIEFNFPVFYQGVETSGISWDLNGTVENVIRLSRG